MSLLNHDFTELTRAREREFKDTGIMGETGRESTPRQFADMSAGKAQSTPLSAHSRQV
jgi:hypothetical protein